MNSWRSPEDSKKKLLPPAQAEIAAALGWYAEKSDGPGGDFSRVIAVASAQVFLQPRSLAGELFLVSAY